MKAAGRRAELLLACTFLLALTVVGLGAWSAPDLNFPHRIYHPYTVPAQNAADLAVTAQGRMLADSPGVRVNINTATAGELRSLPAIGEKLADAIILHRETQGRFSSPKQIMDVPGIGEKTFEGLKDRIYV